MLRSKVPLLILAAIIAVRVAKAAAPVTVPEEGLAEAIVALGPLEGVEAFGVSADLATAVAAVPSTRAAGRSILRIGHREGKTGEIELSGAALGLVVTAPGDVAFVLVRETDRKGAIRRVSLVRVDPTTARAAGSVALPVTALGLALGPGELSLLVACADEIRSFLLPDLTSGPLYRIAGPNVAVAPLSGTTRALVGQAARIALVDLAAPQDRDGLPVIQTTETAAPLRTLVSAPDEPVAIALLEDGSVNLVETEPLRLVPRHSALAVAWPGVKALPSSTTPGIEPAAKSAPEPELESVPIAAVADAAPPPHPEATPESVPPLPPVPAVGEAAAPPSPQPATEIDGATGAIAGGVSGPARSDVGEVVLLGPDNVLKEAVRVAPDASGRYSARELKTGSYRILAAGRGGRVLVCDPPFVTVTVRPGIVLEAPELIVMKAY